jgi:hypothetical protein
MFDPQMFDPQMFETGEDATTPAFSGGRALFKLIRRWF